ncbi:MAG: HAMP domain-containing protein [Chloroflexi bacterium]|nr:HAMP domain-containing protein [Chloroflexota bacterium]
MSASDHEAGGGALSYSLRFAAWRARMRNALLRPSVRIKIMGIVLGLVFLLAYGIALDARTSMSAAMFQQLDERGKSLASDVAARSTDLILTSNAFALRELLRDTLQNNNDVRYALILDTEGHVLAHTFDEGLPRGLAERNHVSAGERTHTIILQSDEGPVHDVAAPIFGGRAGTARIGLSEQRLENGVNALTGRMLLTTLAVSLLGIGAAYLLTLILTRPIGALVEVTQAVGRGDFSQRAPPWGDDELGKLSVAFNRMVADLREKEQIRKHLLEKVIDAQEEERKRIARELHDDTGQALTSLMVGLRAANDAGDDRTRMHLNGLREIAAQTLESVKRMARELRPALLDDLGLSAALERYVAGYRTTYELDTDVQATGFAAGERLPPEVETAVYRIVQESLTNIAKHAHARHVSVVVERKPHALVAIVEDDGQGFDAEAVLAGATSDGAGLGLHGMRERASLIGGRLTIESTPGHGTSIFVEVPLA